MYHYILANFKHKKGGEGGRVFSPDTVNWSFFFFVIEDVAVLQIKSEGEKMLYLVMHFAKKYIQTLLWPSKYKYTRSP